MTIEQVITDRQSCETFQWSSGWQLDVTFVVNTARPPDCHSRKLWREPIVAVLAVELKDDAHCSPPTTGQGSAIDHSPQCRAYIRVDDRERCPASASPHTSSTMSLTDPSTTMSLRMPKRFSSPIIPRHER